MRDVFRFMKTIAGCVIVALVYAGCSSSKEVAPEPRPRQEVNGAAHELALQHFIDASLYELKGEYAQAILEYQDALRYEKNHAIFFALAKNYSLLNKHALAIEAGKEAVRLSPDNLEYRRTLAEAHTAAYNLDGAATEYEEIVKRDSNNIESWYNLARIYQTRKPARALEVFEEITKRFGAEWEVLLQVAELYNSMGQFDKAAEALKRMLNIDPSNMELKRSVAQAYIRAQKPDEAMTLYRELREMSPDNLEYAGELGGVYLMKRMYAEAADQFDPILSRDSVNLDAKLRIGEMYFGQIEKDSTIAPAARMIFERIQDTHADDWRPYWFLGAIGAITNEDSLAVPNFKKVTELASWNADGWVYLSSVFLQKNDFQEVATVLESAQKVLPDDFRVHFFLGVAYHRLGREVEAVSVLERARELNPKDINAISQLALVYDGLKRYEESDSLYEEGLKLDPENSLILNNYGYSLADRGLQLERALEMSKKAVAAQPDNSSYLDTIGWVYYRLGKYAEAERYIRKAIEKGDASAVVHEHLGDIYAKLNDTERALEQWNIALKLDEKNGALKEKISRATQ